MAAREHIQAPIVKCEIGLNEKSLWKYKTKNEKHEMHISDGFSCGFVTNIIFYVDGDSRDNVDYYASMLISQKDLKLKCSLLVGNYK